MKLGYLFSDLTFNDYFYFYDYTSSDSLWDGGSKDFVLFISEYKSSLFVNWILLKTLLYYKIWILSFKIVKTKQIIK